MFSCFGFVVLLIIGYCVVDLFVLVVLFDVCLFTYIDLYDFNSNFAFRHYEFEYY